MLTGDEKSREAMTAVGGRSGGREAGGGDRQWEGATRSAQRGRGGCKTKKTGDATGGGLG